MFVKATRLYINIYNKNKIFAKTKKMLLEFMTNNIVKITSAAVR